MTDRPVTRALFVLGVVAFCLFLFTYLAGIGLTRMNSALVALGVLLIFAVATFLAERGKRKSG